MKFSVFIISFAVLLSEGQAQTPSKTNEQILKAISTRVGIEINSPEFFRTAPPETAWKAFNDLVDYTYAYKNSNLLKQGGQAIAENTAVERYVTDGIAKLPHSVRTSGERTHFLIPLGSVPAPWSLKLLGHYLMDETPISGLESLSDEGYSTTPSLAALALAQMGFSDAPTKRDDFNITPIAEKNWRDWWKANEGRVEQRIYEINPGYVPPQMQQPPTTATPIQTPISTPQVASATPSSTTPKPTAALPSATPAIVTPVNRSNLLIYIIGTVLVLGILFAVIKAFRK